MQLYDDLRAEVSLLMAHGHHRRAWSYTIGTIWREANLVRTRVANTMAAEATLLQAAMASVQSKQGGKNFQKIIEDMLDG